MTKPKPRPKRAVDAIDIALAREEARRPDGLKPIEVVKIAICVYQEYLAQGETPTSARGRLTASNRSKTIESDDRMKIRRGTQSAIDAMLFNANYWRAAYEDRIVAACSELDEKARCADAAVALLDAVTVWRAHPLRLNKLSSEQVIAEFERFCPPFAQNNRRGSDARTGTGKGPLPEFAQAIDELIDNRGVEGLPIEAAELKAVLASMESEASLYEEIGQGDSLDALFDTLPAWCLQDRIELVRGGWWDDCDVMNLLIDRLCARFEAEGYGEAVVQYFADSCREAIDNYQRDISSEPTQFADMEIPELFNLVRKARELHPGYEVDGYGESFPAWLIGKEQLIWNTIVCAIYGPASARPLLVSVPSVLGDASRGGFVHGGKNDVITELAQTSFERYTADRMASLVDVAFGTFAEMPPDLRNSSIEHIRSIPAKLETLGYGIVPAGTCYPEQRVTALTTSEVECLAILEHRRWLRERGQAGWIYDQVKDVAAKKSPYLVPWEELPERAREWNRSAVRNIPALLASVGLAVAR